MEELLNWVLRMVGRVFYENPVVSVLVDYLCSLPDSKFIRIANSKKEPMPILINHADLVNAAELLVEHEILVKDTQKNCSFYYFNPDLINVLIYRFYFLRQAIDSRKDKVFFHILIILIARRKV